MRALLRDVLEEIKPNPAYEKELLSKARAIIRVIQKNVADATAILGGSGAKGTSLKTFDGDIFVKFNYKKYADKSDQLSDILDKSLKKNFKIMRLHGSRDYFQIQDKEYTFEIIPILAITNSKQARNITDVSPLHSQFVKKHKNLTNEMRLTKQFFKAAHSYGAESHIKGFSGYVCEILTVYYGSFEKLVKAIPKWNVPTMIDVADHYKGKNILFELNKSKLQSPIIVIDPVQADRNAAAALDHEKFEIIKHRAKAFIKKPSKEFFEIKTHSIEDIRKQHKKNKIVILKAAPLNKKEDVAGAKLLKVLQFIEADLNTHNFEVVECDMIWKKEEALLFFVLKKDSLPKKVEVKGPPIKMKNHAQAFKKKYKNVKQKGKILVAQSNRQHTSALSLVNDLLKQSHIKQNAKKITVVK